MQYIVTICPRERAVVIDILIQAGPELLRCLRLVQENQAQYRGDFQPFNDFDIIQRNDVPAITELNRRRSTRVVPRR
ncbi:hypothetical protein DFQ00_10812 [Paenibacillus barcinonensis]|uniref:Uncharacterized protein n=1 Tax=Paenibacillus barcinonensis TaxID=198119 RepID=A0A2V4V8W2_PAEBA|nr:hypothetical protein DFQ00_10812 [Paenibacillus barcinonensis]